MTTKQPQSLRLDLTKKSFKPSAMLTALCLFVLVFSTIAMTVVNLKSTSHAVRVSSPLTVRATPVATDDISNVRLMRTTAAPSVTASPDSTNIQSLSTKIADSADASPPPTDSPDAPSPEYVSFWKAFGNKALDNAKIADQAAMTEVRTKFVSDLGFWYNQKDQEVYTSKDSNVLVSVQTLTCYLNGYVPGKSYIKPSCPSN